MSARSGILVIAFSMMCVGVGCDDQAAKPSGASSSAPASSAAAATKPSAAAATASAVAETQPAGGIPTAADFEDEAEQEIGADNAEEKLAQLEKEIEASP